MQPGIIYTYTDEAPMLATHSFLPIIKSFGRVTGVSIETRDISLAGRILALFPDYLNDDQKTSDALKELGELVKKPDANVIKLPNISASIPQIQAAIKELQDKGYAVPDYPENILNDESREVKTRYDRIKGSAVNPVLREGNSDRRSPSAVKEYAKANPHFMGKWNPDSLTHVASMKKGDFFGSEKSLRIEKETSFRIEYTDDSGRKTILRENAPLEQNEILDAAVMSCRELRAFLKSQMDDAKKKKVLFSLHLKATMMKVSDPVIFGHAVSVFFQKVFTKHSKLFSSLDIEPDHGLQDLETKIAGLTPGEQSSVKVDMAECMESGPKLAMVNSDRGITNLHVPSDIIIDASMPAAIRNGGTMWGPDGQEKDMKAVIPDRSYAGVYQAAIDFCKEHGAFNPATMGSVSNVGLMAQKAEEYGSHDKTFIAEGHGTIKAIDRNGHVLLEQKVEKGDIFRMCQVKNAPIQNWVKLAVSRARAIDVPAVFWLDENRPHDAILIERVKSFLTDLDTDKLEIIIMPPAEACRYTLERTRAGQDTISVTGNVLRDYLTDLFPILELGTSAKMLSIIPLMKGGGLFETGAGGSAPKHVQQLLEENHLRWDSLGEFLALAVSYEHLADVFRNKRAALLGKTLNEATGMLLNNRKSPSRKCGELDNRGSHFYLAMYWTQRLASQDEDDELRRIFAEPARALADSEEAIIAELNAVQGKPVDIGGYYKPDRTKADSVMRPCSMFNRIIDSMGNI